MADDDSWALSNGHWDERDDRAWDYGDPEDEDWGQDGEGPASAAAKVVPELFGAGFLPRSAGLEPPGLVSGPAGGFASGGVLDTAPPCSSLAGFAEDVTGRTGRCAGASDDELIGVLRAWGRLEAWAAGARLAVTAELIRRRPFPGSELSGPAAMPDMWGKFCSDELAAATAVSGQAAEKTLRLAHDLAVRLPGTATALREGVIDAYKARIIADLTRVLTAAEAAAAEAIILAKVAGKTPGQVRVITSRAVASVNPAAALARRERAQRDARVELWREDAGTAALCGRDLPPADALAADQRITAYARQLKADGIDGTMDQLRARAFLDLALGIRTRPAASRGAEHNDAREDPAAGHSAAGHPAADGPPAEGGPAAPPVEGGPVGPTGEGGPAEPMGKGGPAEHGPAWDRPEGDGPAGDRPEGDGLAGDRPEGDGLAWDGSAGPGPDGFLAAAINLTIPLTTLLGLAERPGEAASLGAIDPGLARDLARTAAGNPRTTWCLTITDHEGHPTAHGCARRGRGRQPRGRPTTPDIPPGPRPRKGPWPPDGPWPRGPALGSTPGPFRFTADRAQAHAPPGGDGRWRLQLPGAQELTIDLEPLAITDCDHRHESTGYQPSDTLRHLVNVRDGECTWPPCRRSARRCDFEHAIPWDQGGRTCACNAGPRCRHHHHAKQAHGWRLEQNQPGYHTWTTPAGRTYTTGPAEYPI